MKDNLSPEEKLLKLIRQEKTSKLSPTVSEQGKPPEKKTSYRVIDTNRAPYLKYLTSANLHKLMLVVAVLSLVYLAASLLYPLAGLKNIPRVEIPADNQKYSSPKPAPLAKPYEFYSQGLSRRNIFKAPYAEEKAASVTTGTEFTKNINLVGIIAGENPQAIIEDKQAQKTYYVSKGQFIGEYQVQDILEGKIILGYQGKRYELYM